MKETPIVLSNAELDVDEETSLLGKNNYMVLLLYFTNFISCTGSMNFLIEQDQENLPINFSILFESVLNV